MGTTYTQADVERWNDALLDYVSRADLNGAARAHAEECASHLKTAALEGVKVPGLVAERDSALDLIRSAKATLKHLGDTHEISEHAFQELACHLDDEPCGHDGERITTRSEAKVSTLQAQMAELEQRDRNWRTHAETVEAERDAAESYVEKLKLDISGHVGVIHEKLEHIATLQARVAELERERDEAKRLAEDQGALVQAWSDALGLGSGAGYNEAEAIVAERDALRAQVAAARKMANEAKGGTFSWPVHLLEAMDRAPLSAPPAETTPTPERADGVKP